MYAVRKISRAKWEPRPQKGQDWISADAVTGDLRTKGNNLSLWSVEDPEDEKEFLDVVLALAASRERIEKIDIAWFRKEEAEDGGVTIVPTPGKTLVYELQEKHMDAQDLGMREIFLLAKIFAKAIRRDGAVKRVPKGKVKKLLESAVRDGRLSEEDFKKIKEKRRCC